MNDFQTWLVVLACIYIFCRFCFGAPVVKAFTRVEVKTKDDKEEE